MDKKKAAATIDNLYTNINGYALSRLSQSKLNYFYNAHIYGEIDFDSFYDILTLCQPVKNEIFYDLGSGIGKAVIQAALCFPFSKSVGIEKLEDLYLASSKVNQSLNNPSIQFILNDFNNFDFADADIIYLNSYHFYYEMYATNFIRKIERLKKGTRLIFVRMPLISPSLELFHENEYKFSWGASPVYICIKK